MSKNNQTSSPTKQQFKRSQSKPYIDKGGQEKNNPFEQQNQSINFRTPDYLQKKGAAISPNKAQSNEQPRKTINSFYEYTPDQSSQQIAHHRSYSTRLTAETSVKKEYGNFDSRNLQQCYERTNQQITIQTKSPIKRTKYLKKIESNIVTAKPHQAQQQQKSKQYYQQIEKKSQNLNQNHLNQSLSCSQSLKSFGFGFGNTTAIIQDEDDDDNQSMNQLKDISFFNNPNNHSVNTTQVAGNGRIQRLFRKNAPVKGEGSRNEEPKQNRSLSKSISERQLMTQKELKTQKSGLQVEELNMTQTPQVKNLNNLFDAEQTQRILQYEEYNHHSFLRQEETFRTLQNVETMIQQQTPSSSSHQSQYQGETFQEFASNFKSSSPNKVLNYSPQLEKAQSQQYHEITIQRNIDLEVILQFLLQEEETLHNFGQMVQNGQLIELQQQLPMPFQYQYLDLIQSVECKKERPKYFAQQLQVTLILANSLVQVLTPPYLQKFSHKLRNVYTTIHQNFLLFIDQILNCCNANPKENITYILLRKLMVKKLKNKIKSKRITLLRQNNEVNLLVIKKICKQLVNNTLNSGSTLQINNFEQNGFTQFATEFRELGNEILEILRTYDKVTIPTIEERLISYKEAILRQKQQQVCQSPGRRPKSTHMGKAMSPKAQSPKINSYYVSGQYSPRSSNKSDRSNKSSDSNTSRSKKVKPKRAKLIKPNFNSTITKDEPKQVQMGTRLKKSPRNYDVLEEYNGGSQNYTRQDSDTSQTQESAYARSEKKFQQPQNNLLFLPETVAFLLSNSIECNNGITNINNNINIYNTTNLDFKQISQEASKAKMIGKINTKTGEIKIEPKSKIPLVKRSQINSAQKSDTKVITQSPKKQPNKLNQSQTSGIGSGTKNLPKSRITLTRQQQLSRDNSQIDLQAQEELERLSFNHIGLSRETSNISEVSGTTKSKVQPGGKSAANSPTKKKPSMTNRPMSRQLNSSSKIPLDQSQTKQKVNVSKVDPTQINRAKSRQQLQASSSKKNLLNDKNKEAFTPMKEKAADYSTINSVSMTQEKQMKAAQSTNKKSTNVSPYVPKIKGSHVIQVQSTKQSIVIDKNKRTNQSTFVQPKNTPQPQSNKMKIQPKDSQMSQDFISSVGFEVNSSIDPEEHFYTEQRATQSMIGLKPQPTELEAIEPHAVEHRTVWTDKNQDQRFNPEATDDLDHMFRQNESRLDQMLEKMDERNSVKSSAKNLQFGSLIEQHIGSFDLKREMEKLKQLDEEQKRQKKVSLKIQTHKEINNFNQDLPHSYSAISQLTGSGESPTKKILLGEFDELKDEDDEALYLNLGDDVMLLKESSRTSNNPIISPENKNLAGPPPENFNFNDYITEKTGMVDPFPDHQDPNEELTPSCLKLQPIEQVNLATEEDEHPKDEDEFQNLRSAVKIPYLPDLPERERDSTYTLVLDLDETLIHFECDDEAQDEDEQGYYLIRPGAIKFLNELSKYYELVIFTAAMPDYADWILDNVDRHRIIKHRLYRQHTTPHEDYAIKDLKNLGRPLERTIIIDNLAENFLHTTPDNGIWVESWYDDMEDTVLEILMPFLKEIVKRQVPDVRKILTKQIKENIIYRCLEEGQDIPSVKELLKTPKQSPSKRVNYEILDDDDI